MVKRYFQTGKCNLKRKDVSIQFQLASSIPKGFIYVSIVAQNTIFNGLSGKYIFKSMKNNKPAFIRAGGELPQVTGKNYFLAHYDALYKAWYIQNERNFSGGQIGGFLRNKTTGMF